MSLCSLFRYIMFTVQIYNFFLNWCCHYQEIYDWILSFNKRSGLPFILTQHSMRKNEYGKSGHLSTFTLLKHLIILLMHNFFRASLLHLIKDTGSMWGYAAQIFKQWKHCKTMPLTLKRRSYFGRWKDAQWAKEDIIMLWMRWMCCRCLTSHKLAHANFLSGHSHAQWVHTHST